MCEQIAVMIQKVYSEKQREVIRRFVSKVKENSVVKKLDRKVN